ncbi:MAG: hypothetical protein LBF74_07175 [Treponema sp.]|jgi:hypothetical protein|nr:hypothetical protein [Treponema sp.]
METIDIRIGNRSDALNRLDWTLDMDNPEKVTGGTEEIIKAIRDAIEREIL